MSVASQMIVSKNNIGYLFGADSLSGIRQDAHGIDRASGMTDLWHLRSRPAPFDRLHIPANFARNRFRPALDHLSTILNIVTDPDLNPKVLKAADRFLRGFAGRVINPPQAVLANGREHVSRTLAGIDSLVVPAVARFRGKPRLADAAIARAGVTFPAILRLPGTHNGEIVALLPDRAALDPLIEPHRTYLLTSFVDGRGDDPLHHKIRLFWFGDRAVIRHMIVSDHWNVHGPDRERVMPHQPDWVARERALLAAGLPGLPAPARAAMKAIRARMPLDYFGIDFALLPDGRALLFEANAAMNFFPLSTDPAFAYAGEPIVATARGAFDAMLAGDLRAAA